jgi:hypothetical protein
MYCTVLLCYISRIFLNNSKLKWGFDFKSFPLNFEDGTLRNLSIDPTDGFGSDTRVYISNNQVVQIEPDYNIQTFNTWLTDKGRQFFDGIFETWTSNEGDISTTKNSWLKILKTISQTVYFFEHCQAQHRKIIPLSLF